MELNQYPAEITTDVHNTELWSFVPESAMLRIKVTPVTGVSEKQINYAMERKSKALASVDKIAARMYPKMKAEYKDSLIIWRNNMMIAINAEQSAKVVLDKLADADLSDPDELLKIYGIKIA